MHAASASRSARDCCSFFTSRVQQADTSSKLGTKYTIPQRDFFKATVRILTQSILH